MRVLDALSEQPSLSDRDFVGADGQLFSVFPLQAVAMAMGEGAGDRSERRWASAAPVALSERRPSQSSSCTSACTSEQAIVTAHLSLIIMG